MAANTRQHPQAFEAIPDALLSGRLAIRCLIADEDADLCSGWLTSVDAHPRDIRLDGEGMLHFAEHIPTECGECGDRVLEMNGVPITFQI